jgi:integrase
MRAIVLCLATGGMRINELLSIRCSDIDLKPIPTKIELRAIIDNKKVIKTGKNRFTFISSEATSAVREWIKVRPAYLESSSKMGKNFKTKNMPAVDLKDQRLFPISDRSVGDALKVAVDAALEGGNKKCQPRIPKILPNSIHGNLRW